MVSCPPTRPSPRAFTLVELLVVIGIIALLIAILLPSLNKAREQANWTKCSSNMKQVATSIIMYCNEYKGFFPWRASGGYGARPTTKAGAAFQYALDWIRWQDATTGYSGSDGPVSIDESAVAPFLNMTGDKLMEVLRCPSDDVTTHENRSGLGQYLYSYTMNYRLTFDDATSKDMYRRLTQVRRSSEKAMLAEEKNPNDGYWVNPGDLITERHQKRGNIAFFDSHVETMYQTEFAGNLPSKYPFQE